MMISMKENRLYYTIQFVFFSQINMFQTRKSSTNKHDKIVGMFFSICITVLLHMQIQSLFHCRTLLSFKMKRLTLKGGNSVIFIFAFLCNGYQLLKKEFAHVGANSFP